VLAAQRRQAAALLLAGLFASFGERITLLALTENRNYPKADRLGVV
jgi:hypothetical protein